MPSFVMDTSDEAFRQTVASMPGINGADRFI